MQFSHHQSNEHDHRAASTKLMPRRCSIRRVVQACVSPPPPPSLSGGIVLTAWWLLSFLMIRKPQHTTALLLIPSSHRISDFHRKFGSLHQNVASSRETCRRIAVEQAANELPAVDAATGLRKSTRLRTGDLHSPGKFPDNTSLRDRKNRMKKTVEQVEVELSVALASIRAAWASHTRRCAADRGDDPSLSLSSVVEIAPDDVLFPFPTERECNSALAALGDSGELQRGLRLFFKMRKATALAAQIRERQLDVGRWPVVPAPTLVTYSTLMSRAVKASKPAVALRLWKLMMTPQQQQQQRVGDGSHDAQAAPETMVVSPDVKAANILMNCYAKMADAKRARALLRQMKTGIGPDVHHPLRPNLVTYNTLIDACHRAGDLEAALRAKRDLEESGLRPDARTYTSLIATVARGRSRVAGRNDPTPAFALLREMREIGIRPNAITYSALIDACGRCKRSDLALQGLRIMLRQKAEERRQRLEHAGQTLPEDEVEEDQDRNEVGAWTAAINACGRACRWEAALRLFYAMPNFGVQPNTITCGCLTDSLLRGGRTAETLDVLRYMKGRGLVPTEVMYTSLMMHASRLAQQQQRQQWRQQQNEEKAAGDTMRTLQALPETPAVSTGEESGDSDAIKVYTELMVSLMENCRPSRTTSRPSDVRRSHSDRRCDRRRSDPLAAASFSSEEEDATAALVRVFLVFQQMKSAGAQPDLACFNALLRACARAGDAGRCRHVLKQMRDAGLDPNDTSWRQLLRAAAKERDSDGAIAAWKQALSHRGIGSGRASNVAPSSYRGPVTSTWKPSVESWSAFVSAFLREATSGENGDNPERRRSLYRQVVQYYDAVLSGSEDMGMDRIDPMEVLDNERTMLLVLQAIVFLHDLEADNDNNHKSELQEQRQSSLKKMATSIFQLECFHNVDSKQRLTWAALRAFRKAQFWSESG